MSKKNGQESKRCSRIAAVLDCDDNVQALRDRLKRGPATDVMWDSKLNKFRLVYAESDMSSRYGKELERKFEAGEKQRREKLGLQVAAPKNESGEASVPRFNISNDRRA